LFFQQVYFSTKFIPFKGLKSQKVMFRRILSFYQRYPILNKILLGVRKWVFRLFLAHLAYTVLLIWLPVYTTPTIVADWISGTKIKKQWVPFNRISEPAMRAVIAAEDQEFAEHFGFDTEAIEKAIAYNKTHKRKKGASTITQQVAKNVFLWQGRTWLRKGLEVYCTFLIEILWSKERILEIYLNVAEMGEGIYGIEAASQNYYKKNASSINADEAATVAACLPNPVKFKVNQPSDHVLKRKRWILWQMKYVEWEK
jgi:monofunctional glycosyltransferase